MKEPLLDLDDMLEFSTCYWILTKSNLSEDVREHYLQRLKEVMKTQEDFDNILKQILKETEK